MDRPLPETAAPLTARERDVAMRRARGGSLVEIAHALAVEPRSSASSVATQSLASTRLAPYLASSATFWRIVHWMVVAFGLVMLAQGGWAPGGPVTTLALLTVAMLGCVVAGLAALVPACGRVA